MEETITVEVHEDREDGTGFRTSEMTFTDLAEAEAYVVEMAEDPMVYKVRLRYVAEFNRIIS